MSTGDLPPPLPSSTGGAHATPLPTTPAPPTGTTPTDTAIAESESRDGALRDIASVPGSKTTATPLTYRNITHTASPTGNGSGRATALGARTLSPSSAQLAAERAGATRSIDAIFSGAPPLDGTRCIGVRHSDGTTESIRLTPETLARSKSLGDAGLICAVQNTVERTIIYNEALQTNSSGEVLSGEQIQELLGEIFADENLSNYTFVGVSEEDWSALQQGMAEAFAVQLESLSASPESENEGAEGTNTASAATQLPESSHLESETAKSRDDREPVSTGQKKRTHNQKRKEHLEAEQRVSDIKDEKYRQRETDARDMLRDSRIAKDEENKWEARHDPRKT